jgi:hypothetical protein
MQERRERERENKKTKKSSKKKQKRLFFHFHRNRIVNQNTRCCRSSLLSLSLCLIPVMERMNDEWLVVVKMCYCFWCCFWCCQKNQKLSLSVKKKKIIIKFSLLFSPLPRPAPLPSLYSTLLYFTLLSTSSHGRERRLLHLHFLLHGGRRRRGRCHRSRVTDRGRRRPFRATLLLLLLLHSRPPSLDPACAPRSTAGASRPS